MFWCNGNIPKNWYKIVDTIYSFWFDFKDVNYGYVVNMKKFKIVAPK